MITLYTISSCSGQDSKCVDSNRSSFIRSHNFTIQFVPSTILFMAAHVLNNDKARLSIFSNFLVATLPWVLRKKKKKKTHGIYDYKYIQINEVSVRQPCTTYIISNELIDAVWFFFLHANSKVSRKIQFPIFFSPMEIQSHRPFVRCRCRIVKEHACKFHTVPHARTHK